MQNHLFRVSGVALLLGVLLGSGTPQEAAAGVDVGINVNIGPPPIMVPEPPAVVLVPRSRVYFVPGLAFDVFFHDGYWWSPRGERWYRARDYNGPWRVIERRSVPAPVFRMPGDYRVRYVRERHIPYGQWKKEGRHLEGRDRDHDGYRDRRRAHDGNRYDRGDHGERGRGDHGRGHGR